MRGRTNYTGGAMPVIHGTLKKYEVANGSTVSKGDFVQFTTLTNTETILNSYISGVSKIKVSDTLYLCMGASGANYGYVVCLVSVEGGVFKILGTESIVSARYTYSYPNVVECNGRYFVMDTTESLLYELVISGNSMTKVSRCATHVSCPALTSHNNKIIALGVSSCGTSSSSPSKLSYEIYTIAGDGSITASGIKSADIGTYIYDDIGDVYPKVINGYIYMIGAWYGGSSTTHGGSAICFKFDDSSNTISISNSINVGSSNYGYNQLFGGNFDVLEDCGCYFEINNYSSPNKGILSVIKAGSTVSNLNTFQFPIAESQISGSSIYLYSGLCIPEGKDIAILVHNYVKSSSESASQYRVAIELLGFSRTSYTFTEISRLLMTYEELGITPGGTGAATYIRGVTTIFHNNTFYCMCSLYNYGAYSTVLLTFELLGTSIVFKGLKKIKPHDGNGFAIGFANQNGSSGDNIDIYVPKATS